MSNKALFKFEHGAIIRVRKHYFPLMNLNLAREWLTITGKNVQVKLHY